MARNDGIDRTSVRNLAVSDKAVGNTQQHNEREKDSYRNPDIIPQRTAWNIHFKKPTASYTDLFSQLETAGTISTRGLKPDATHYCELVFDVNSAYFDNHGGYEFAKQFYEDAYQAAVQIVGGEQYILSAVMHADEINRAMTEALGREVYHYHLHVVYVPVVKKQILWSKRCNFDAGPREANAVQHGVVCFPYRKLSVPPDALGKGRCRWVEHDTLNAVSVRECL